MIVVEDSATESVSSSPAEKQSAPDTTERGDKNLVTVFVSNVDFNKKEADLYEVMSRVGEVKDIRLVKGLKGKNRGFGYVEFKEEVRQFCFILEILTG